MFQMTQVGRTIASLRKEKGMTQMELADRMGVSFQAVSNWERGNSMPDISKLPDLAELFGVSVDAILGKRSELTSHFMDGTIQDYLETHEVKPEELAEAAPILKPFQAEQAAEKLACDDLEALEGILPYLSDSQIARLANRACERGGGENLAILAPFMKREELESAARKLLKKTGDPEAIEDIAPFLSEAFLREVADASYERFGIEKIDFLFPFLPKDALKDLATREYAKSGMRDLAELAPFLERGFLDDLAEKAVEKDGICAIDEIAPFLSREVLERIVDRFYP